MSQSENVALQKSCPNCGGTDLYGRRLAAAGGYGPNFLAGLGSFMRFASFDVVLCADCGLTRMFAEPDARQKVKSTAEWKKL